MAFLKHPCQIIYLRYTTQLKVDDHEQNMTTFGVTQGAPSPLKTKSQDTSNQLRETPGTLQDFKCLKPDDRYIQKYLEHDGEKRETGGG